MPTFLEQLEKLDLLKAKAPVVPGAVAIVLDRLGMTMMLTSPSVPEQWAVVRHGQPCGYIRVRFGGISVDYPDAGDERLYEGPVDGFGGLTDHERPTQLLLALGMIAARMLK